MLQDVYVCAPRRLNGQRGHEEPPVEGRQLFWRITMRLSDQSPQGSIALAAMGHQQVLMSGVKGDNRPPGERATDKKLPTVIAKHPLDEVIPQDRIAKPAFVF